MKEFGIESFGEFNAADYDRAHDPGTTEQAVATLWQLAAGQRTLELAIGTGRLALPLKARGLEIVGIEASPAMVDQLRAKPGGADIPVVIGDMAQVDAPGTYDFAFLVFNTLFNLRTQEAQVACFANVARRLNRGGRFLIETFVPDLSGFRNHQSLRTLDVAFASAQLEAAIHDPVTQTVDYQRITLGDSGVRTSPLPIRYAWPAEIDLMARLAGLSLVDRWGSWEQAPFTADSRMHVSLYQKVDAR